MALAVCLLFDAAGDRLVRQLWTRLEAQGVPTLLTRTHRRHRPHLSLAVARSWDLEQVLDALHGLPAAEPFAATFPGIVAFTRGRVSLSTGGSAARLPAISNVVNDALPLTIGVEAAAVIDSGTAQAWPLRWLL